MFSSIHRRLDELSPHGMSRPELESAVEVLSKLESHAVERRLAFLAAIDDLNDGGVPAKDVNRSRARRSKRSSKKAAKTAAKLKKMPKTRDALANGEITEEHADAAADAAEETSEEEADDALVDDAKAQPADMFERRARDWANSKQDEDEKRSRLERQRAKREAKAWTNPEGMTVLFAKFDPVVGKEITSRLEEVYEQMWRADGGREGSPDLVRSPEQRRADALAAILTSGAGRTKRPHPKHMAIVRLDYERVFGSLDGEATLIDGEALPQSVLDRIVCDGALVGAIFGTDGAVLWQGRSVRLATDEQWAQLVVRDGGCVGCGASPSHCEAHHIDYWEHQGPTDIDNLVLVCSGDHHLLHDGSHVLMRSEGGWKIVRKSAQRRPTAEAA